MSCVIFCWVASLRDTARKPFAPLFPKWRLGDKGGTPQSCTLALANFSMDLIQLNKMCFIIFTSSIQSLQGINANQSFTAAVKTLEAIATIF